MSDFIQFGHFGELRDVNPTDEEAEIFEKLFSIVDAAGLDAEEMQFVRKSDNYVTASIEPTDIARFKFTKRAKWILFPCLDNVKHKIEAVSDLDELSEMIVQAYKKAVAINNY